MAKKQIEQTQEIETERKIKSVDELEFTDDFMFGTIMQMKKFAKVF